MGAGTGVIVALLIGCATAEPPAQQGVVISAAELAELKAAASQVGALQRQLLALQQRLLLTEQRLGLAALSPDNVRPAPGALTMRFRKATVVDEDGGRGKKTDLGRHLSQYRGVVFAFWATWCKPCIADIELKHLRDLKKQLARHDIELVSMAIDSLAKVKAHPRASKWMYPLWQQDDGHIEMLPRALIDKVGLGLPLFVIADPDGRIRYIRNKQLDDAAVRDIVSATATVCRM